MTAEAPASRAARLWIPAPWDSRIVAILATLFLGTYVLASARLFAVSAPPAVLGSSAIGAVQVFTCVVVAALLIPRRRNRAYGWIILAFGGCITAIAVMTATLGPSSGVHHVVRSPLFILAVLAFVLFDTGRVQSWIDRRLTIPLSLLAILMFIGVVLVSPRLPAGAVGLDCTGACPITGMNIADAPGATTFFANAYLVTRTLAMIAVGVALVQRYRGSTGTFRTMMRPVALIGVLYMLAGAIAGIIDLADLGSDAMRAITPLLFLTRITLPLAIGAGVLLGELRRGGTLERDFAALRAVQTPAALQHDLRALLEDPTLRVVLPGQDAASGDQALTELRSNDGRLLATVCHRRGLEGDQPVGFHIALPAATLALERLEIEGQIAAMEQQLVEARRTAVLAGDEERRRIEQDLHDGAQLRIILLRGRIERLAARTAPQHAASQDEMEAMLGEADDLLSEIRRLSAGMRRVPPGQLREALHDLGAAAQLVTRVDIGPLGTLSPDAEQAIYFCVSEAVQNAAKHAGPQASVIIAVARDGTDVVFTVSDNGSGAPGTPEPGRGVAGMADRLSAAGGALEGVVALPFGGTMVRGRVPADAVSRSATRGTQAESR